MLHTHRLHHTLCLARNTLLAPVWIPYGYLQCLLSRTPAPGPHVGLTPGLTMSFHQWLTSTSAPLDTSNIMANEPVLSTTMPSSQYQWHSYSPTAANAKAFVAHTPPASPKTIVTGGLSNQHVSNDINSSMFGQILPSPPAGQSALWRCQDYEMQQGEPPAHPTSMRQCTVEGSRRKTRQDGTTTHPIKTVGAFNQPSKLAFQTASSRDHHIGGRLPSLAATHPSQHVSRTAHTVPPLPRPDNAFKDITHLPTPPSSHSPPSAPSRYRDPSSTPTPAERAASRSSTSSQPPWRQYSDPMWQTSTDPAYWDRRDGSPLRADTCLEPGNVVSPTHMIGLPFGGMVEMAHYYAEGSNAGRESRDGRGE